VQGCGLKALQESGIVATSSSGEDAQPRIYFVVGED
jgi:hypothetical protein